MKELATKPKPRRTPVPSEIEDQVLLLSARRCALCFHLFNKQGVKKGQVAHLDQRRANNIVDNLAFLCLEHHSEYDSTTSQHKNYTITEVKHARRLLYRWVKRGKPALAKGLQNKASELSESAAGPAAPQLYVESIRTPQPPLEMIRLRNDGPGTITNIQIGPLRWGRHKRPLALFNNVGIIPAGEHRDVHYYLVQSEGPSRSLYDFLRTETSMNALTTVGFTYDSGDLTLRRDFELTTEISQGLITWRAVPVQIRLPNDPSLAKLHVGNGQNLGYVGQHVSVDGVVVSNAETRQETFAVSVAGSIEYSHSSGKQLLVEPASWYIQGADGVIKHDVMPHISSMDSRTFSLPILFRTDDNDTYFAAHNSALRPDPAYELVWGAWSVSVTLRSGADRWERRLRVDLNPSTPPAWTVLP